MSDNKKYYYLKLKDNFFDSEEIKVLEGMENGYKYSNILLKMYLKSIKREGLLLFNERIPYNPKMIATITGHNINDVKQSLEIFKQMGLIEILSNGAIYMLDIQNFIGQSTTEADRIRAYRNKIEGKKERLLKGEDVSLIDACTNVQQKNDKSNNKCTPEIEIELELELEKDIEIEIEKEIDIKDREEKSSVAPYKEIKNLYHDICISYSKIRTISSERKKHIKARWKQYDDGLEVFKELFTLAEESNFLKGENNRNWKANFDWMMNENNMAKVLEGRYTNEQSSSDTGKQSIDDEKFTEEDARRAGVTVL